MKTFRAPWGLPLLIISAMVTAVLLIIAWCVPVAPGLISFWPKLLPLVVLLSALPFVVRRYEITLDAILIPRLFWTTRIPREGLIGATFEPRVMKGSLRLFGNGGMYAFNGIFWNRALGRYHAFVTDTEKTVVLRFENRVVVLSPENPAEFVRELTGNLT